MSKILSVTQLTNAIKQKLEGTFSFISVQGEVSNLRKQASGHIYFTLKDGGAQLSAALFRGSAAKLSQLPKEGDQVILSGELSVYPPRGGYQLIVREVRFSGAGQLLLMLQERKQKLEKLGWFSDENKKTLPHLPKTIGVVTSPTGAVIQDILNILKRRFPNFHLILNPVKVQGEGAAEEIAKAIEEFNTHNLADVLIVGRGGGSLEDLWPFNEECVAKAIFESKIPIISAVGHETDFTLADFAADVRAPTPSAAAEIVMPSREDHLNELAKSSTRLVHAIQNHLRGHKRMLGALVKHPSISSPYTFLSKYMQLLDGVKENLDETIFHQMNQRKLNLNGLARQKEASKPSNQIAYLTKNFKSGAKDLDRVMRQKLYGKKERLKRLEEHLRAIDPRNLLTKGYSIAFAEKNDSVILRSSDVEVGDSLKIQLSDGKILVKVEEK